MQRYEFLSTRKDGRVGKEPVFRIGLHPSVAVHFPAYCGLQRVLINFEM